MTPIMLGGNKKYQEQDSEIGVSAFVPPQNQFWQSFTDENTFVGVQQSIGGVLAHHQNKKPENRHNEEGKKNSFALFA